MTTVTRCLLTNSIILTVLPIVLLMVLTIANKLIDRTTIKKKDEEIEELKAKNSNLSKQNITSKKTEEVAKATSELVSELGKEQVKNAQTSSSLKEQAKNVKTIEDAIALAKKQVEENNRATWY